MRVARREHNECRVGEDQYWNNMIQIKEIWYYTDLFYFKGIFMLVALTVADDSTQRISFEVKLNVHVLSLWIRAQQLELNTDHETVQIYSVDKQHKKTQLITLKTIDLCMYYRVKHEIICIHVQNGNLDDR